MSETNLAAAIEVIQRAAVSGSAVQLFPIAAEDGAGGTVTIPGIAVANQQGICTQNFLDVLKQGSAWAKEQRLAKAAGPDRRRGSAHHQSLLSFNGHVNRFKSEKSAVWANPETRQLISILDYHQSGAESPAAWCLHRGTYSCPLSEAWNEWGGGEALKVSQDDFALLLDSRDRELIGGKLPNGAAAPEPSYLITLANNLEVYSNATAKRERDTNTGKLKISFSEEKGVSGTVAPPPSFLVNIPVFQDAAPQVIEIRLRVSVEDGQAQFSVQIHAAADLLRASFGEVCNEVARATSVPLFVGTAEQG